MLWVTRVVSVLVVALCLLAVPRHAQGGVALAIELRELVRASDQIVVATALEAVPRWETVGRQRRIVTYTRVRVDEQLSGGPAGGELWVRTLGGRVGKIGQIVHGEARLSAGRPALLFLEPHAAGLHRVVAMAQGHFPLRADRLGQLRLQPSPELSVLQGSDRSAVRLLQGLTLSDARVLVRSARP